MATLEERMQQGSAAEKARARDRRLELRAVLRGVTEPGASAEERLRLLQTKYAQAVQEQARHDAEVLALQEQLAAATKDGETGARGGGGGQQQQPRPRRRLQLTCCAVPAAAGVGVRAPQRTESWRTR